MSKTKISTKNQNLLWARSAGRCEYEGCNEVLYQDILTKKNYNAAYIAHIVADEPNGPRGDAERSGLLNDNISNLMLLCDRHHRLVDKEDVAGHSEERLLEMKRKHEERIRRLTAIKPEMKSEIVLYGANIGKHTSLLSYERASDALFPDYYPACDRAIELSLKNVPFEDKDEEFWECEARNLQLQFDDRIKPGISLNTVSHISLFALAPQPLLIKLGTLLNDLYSVRVFQKHREPDTWRWSDNGTKARVILNKPESCEFSPVLLLGLSAHVDHKRIRKVLGDRISVWEITTDNPGNDFLQLEETLSDFRKLIRDTLDQIKYEHGCTELKVFPVMPVAVAVELGRVWMPKADMPLVIYDENKKNGGFFRTITIN